MALWYFKCPFEYVLLSGWRIQSNNWRVCIKLYQIINNRIIIIFKPSLKILLSRKDIVNVFNFSILEWLLLKRNHLFVLRLVIQDLVIYHFVLSWYNKDVTQKRYRNSVILQFLNIPDCFDRYILFINSSK